MALESCRTFVAPTGKAGFALQANGDLAGYIYDFFVSPLEPERSLYDLMFAAVEQGANKLAAFDNPLLIQFFERFGFQAVAAAKRGDSAVVHMILISEVFEKRAPTLSELTRSLPLQQPGPGSEVACVSCGGGVSTTKYPAAEVGGYCCPRCGFLRIFGTLTLGQPASAQP